MRVTALICALLLSPFASAQLQSYLVTWDPHTVSSRDDFYKYLPDQASFLLELWKSKSVENVYLDPQQKDIKGEDIPMVTLVLKAKNEEQAHQLLSNMPYVKNKVIQYSLNPIGTFWLGQYDPSLFTSSKANADNIILINPFEVPEGKGQAALQHWEKSRDFLKNQPGYISTRLHRTIQPNAKFHLINVAEWESEEAFKTAIAEMNKALDPSDIKGLKFYPALYEEIRN